MSAAAALAGCQSGGGGVLYHPPGLPCGFPGGALVIPPEPEELRGEK